MQDTQGTQQQATATHTLPRQQQQQQELWARLLNTVLLLLAMLHMVIPMVMLNQRSDVCSVNKVGLMLYVRILLVLLSIYTNLAILIYFK